MPNPGPEPSQSTLASLGWQGDLRLGLGWGLFRGAAGHNTPHAHHALQVVLSTARQQLWVQGQPLPAAKGVVLGADVSHRLAASAAPVTLLYLEPDSRAGRRLATTLCQGWRSLDDTSSRAALLACRAEDPAAAAVACLVPRAAEVVTPAGDAVIEQLIASLPPALPRNPRLADLAAATGLSASRLQHRFRAHTGMALRPYWRWRRLLVALSAVRHGETLSDAAHAAGFADAAHFTRTLRRHFGITPRVLTGLAGGP